MNKKFFLGSLFLAISFSAFADAPGWFGYPSTQYQKISVAANTTASFEVTINTARFSLFLQSGASVTFNRPTGTVTTASSGWEIVPATFSMNLVPQTLGKGSYIWIDNGGSAQDIYYKGFGK